MRTLAMLIAIENARYVDGYRIWLRFNTAEEGVADLTNIASRTPTPRNFCHRHREARHF
jgi:hypothetical protein